MIVNIVSPSARFLKVLFLSLFLLLCLSTAAQAQTRQPDLEFDLHSDNDFPIGIWSDSTTVWVTDSGDSLIYAYTLSDGSRDETKDIDLYVDTGLPFSFWHGIWSDGATMWAVDAVFRNLYAYTLSDGSRDETKDIDLHDDNDNPQGIWSNGTTMWVVDIVDNKLYAYTLTGNNRGNRDPSKEFDLHRDNSIATGIWSNGTTAWVVDLADDKLYAYRLSDGRRIRAQEFDLHGNNASHYGIWSNGTTVWVVSLDDEKLYAYTLPIPGRLALTALYNATGGDNWTNNSNWKTSRPLGDWHGVVTDSNGNVTQLALVNNNLVGELPDELDLLADTLTTLMLAGNPDLTGCIPANLRGVATNDFSTLGLPVCTSSGDRTTLAALYDALGGANWTTNTHWKSDRPLREWYGVTVDSNGRVTALALANNNLMGNLPTDLGNLAALTELHLNDNRLTGDIPAELNQLADTLTTVMLAGNSDLTGCIPDGLATVANNDFAHPTSLPACSGAARDRVVLTAFYDATDGNRWENNDNWKTNMSLRDWHGVTTDNDGRVTGLDLRNNDLMGSLPTDLDNLAELETLSLSRNSVTGNIPAELGNLADLESLDLGNNMLTGSIPAELGNLVNLRGLYLYNNALTGAIPAELGNLPALTTLRLDGNYRLTGAIPAELGDLNNLERLDLDRNRLTGAIPVELGRLANLEVLWLSHNDLTGEIPAELGNLDGLEELYLDNNDLTGSIPVELDQLADTLTRLQLVGNSGLAGCIPANLGGVSLNDLAMLGLPACASPGDRAVLERFYDATDGANWRRSTYWKTNRPLRQWYGVTVDGNDRVTGLTLANNNLTGSLPTDLGDLAELETLSLSRNTGLTGNIPTELGNLANLESLNLSGNSVSGAIPSALANLGALTELRLDDNMLTGEIPAALANLGALTELRLDDNMLTGEIPAELGDLADTLTTVMLAGNSGLTGCLPDSLRNVATNDLTTLGLLACAALEDRAVLEILYNATNGDGWMTNTHWKTDRPLREWYGVTTDADARVTGLDLPLNNLAGTLPAELGSLANLESLELFDNVLTGVVPAALGNLTVLSTLDLENNQLTGEIPAELGNLTALTYLNLRNNRLTGAIPAELGNLTALTHLNLRNNQLTGATPTTLGNLTALTNLNLGNNRLTGAIPATLGNLPALTNLNLGNNRLTGAIPAELSNIPNLRELYLHGNDLTGAIPAALGNIAGLTNLLLVNNNLSGDIPAELGDLADTLVLLRLAGNTGLTGCLPANLGGIGINDFNRSGVPALCASPEDRAALVALYDATGGASWTNRYNWKTDTHIRQWQGVTIDAGGRVTRLALANNNLAGELPAELANLADTLTRLQLAGNSGLTGCLPDSLREVPADSHGLSACQPRPMLVLTPNPVTEGETATVTATLAEAPTAAVTLTVSAEAVLPAVADDFTLSTDRVLTIAMGQTVSTGEVTIATTANNIAELDKPIAVSAALTGASGILTPPARTLAITDDDIAAVTVTVTDNTTSETGETAILTVKLTSEPTADVMLTLTSSDPGEGRFTTPAPDTPEAPIMLTFTGMNWNTAQTVTVTGQDDATNDDDRTYQITVATSSSDTNYNNLPVTATDLMNIDDDDRDINVSETELPVTEGATGEYTVVLTTEPIGNVTITPTSSNTAAATVSGVLTFTAANYNMPQTVTVTGVDDDNATNETFNITHTVAGADYGDNDVMAADVEVTLSDDDSRGVTVNVGATPLPVSETGINMYTVVLATEPTDNVTITPSSENTAATTVSGVLTFTAANWSMAQAITVTGIDDDNAVDEIFDITHTVTGADYETNNVTAADVEVTLDDDDERGISVSKTELTVSETGTNIYTVVLTTEPSEDVTVTPSSRNTTAATVSDALTFTAANWSMAQTVTVTGVDDDDNNNESSEVTHTVTGGDYGDNNITAEGVTVTVLDNEREGVTVRVVNLAVDEDSTVTYPLVLNTRPSGNVTVTPSSNNTAVSLSDALSFTTANYNMPQTVTVRGVQDDNAVDETALISHTVTGYGDVRTAAAVTVNVMDDDTPSVTVSETEMTVTEGVTGEYTVVLSTEPTGNVTITPTSSNTAAATVSAALVFSSDNWDTMQTVTVTGVDDDNATGEALNITHSVAGADYAAVTAADVTITLDDDDEQGLTVTPTTLPVNEGATGEYTVVLDTEPTDNVTVTPTSSNTAVATVSAALTFSAANWSMAQTITVTGVNDNNMDNESFDVTHTVAGADYGTVMADDVTVTLNDNDAPGVTVSVTNLTVDEGSTGTYTVVLNTPGGEVTVTPSSDNTDVSTSTALAFDTLPWDFFGSPDWDIPQAVTVTVAQDDDTADETAVISHRVASLNDAYNEVSVNTVRVTIRDDDMPVITVVAEPASVTEGEAAVFTLTRSDTDDPVLAVTVSVTQMGSFIDGTLPTMVTFGNSEPSTTVSVPTDDDTIIEDNGMITLAITDEAAYDLGGDGMATVTVIDDDTPSVTVSTATLNVTEGATGKYTVVLNTQPTGNVTITPTSSITATATVSGALTFTDSNWDTPQNVTVNGVEVGEATISHAVMGAGTDYSSVTARPVTVTVSTFSESDINQSGDLNDDDALLVFYLATFGTLLETSGSLRNRLMNGLHGGFPNDDNGYQQIIVRAKRWLQNSYYDINMSGEVNDDDALLIFYLETFGSLLETSSSLRSRLMNGLHGGFPNDDTGYQMIITRIKERFR